ncbi:Fasciclin domain-containing protein [Ceratobasidium sp. AG-Ba]|nr:Fasciclin domain-containing protein [Ceratobasidium sp. AG-Ba]
MILSALFVSALCSASNLVEASPVTQGGDEFASAFVNALKKNGVTTAANAYLDFFANNESKPLLDIIKAGPVTLFVPKNEAFGSDHPSIDGDIFFFNTVYGNIDNGFKTPGSSLSPPIPNQNRLLGKSAFKSAGLAGSSGKPTTGYSDNQIQQVTRFVAGNLKRWPPIFTVDRSVGVANVEKQFSFKSVVVLVIDGVLSLPTTVSDLLCKPLVVAAPNGFAKFLGSLQKVGLLEAVDGGKRLTVFAPTNEAFIGVDTDNISDDDLKKILKNHWVLGTVAYSAEWPLLSKVTTESGNELRLTSENGVKTVTCGSSTANVLRSDVASSNGAIHILDTVLKCE